MQSSILICIWASIASGFSSRARLTFQSLSSNGKIASLYLKNCELFAKNVNVPPEWQEVLDSAPEESDKSSQIYDESADQISGNTKNEWIALLQGQSIPIQIGSVELARKAWKKRRRSYSPILVPCSIINIPHKTAVRNNIVYLVNQFGDSINESFDDVLGGGKGGGAGVVLSVTQLKSFYRKVFGGNLTQHAIALNGSPSIASLLEDMMDSHMKVKYGIEVVGGNQDEDQLLIMSSLPKRRARDWVRNIALVQVSTTLPEVSSVDKNAVKKTPMTHTGMVKVRRPIENAQKSNNKKTFRWSMEPLGAALRIAQQRSTGSTGGETNDSSSKSESSSNGMEFLSKGETRFAHVLQFDTTGDGDGSPLLTLCLDPPKGALLEKTQRRKNIQRQQEAFSKKLDLINNGFLSSKHQLDHMLEDLSVGDGPFTATVVNISERSKAAFVDLSVGRNKGKSAGGGLVPVLGMLRFEDIEENALRLHSVEANDEIKENDNEEIDEDDDVDDYDDDDDDDEEAYTIEDLFQNKDDIKYNSHYELEDENESSTEIYQDVSDMYEIDDRGVMYEISNTGEKVPIGYVGGDDDDFEEDEKEEATPKAFTKRKPKKSKVGPNRKTLKDTTMKKLPVIKVGDEMPVYIESISPQSGRFMVTLDPSVQDMSPKEIKQSKSISKKMSKLTDLLGGDSNLQKLLGMTGTECEGTIKATSQTGDWFYVQPEFEMPGVGVRLPVGVGLMEVSDLKEELSPGDKVQIRLDGVDSTRGQLSVKVLGKLSP